MNSNVSARPVAVQPRRLMSIGVPPTRILLHSSLNLERCALTQINVRYWHQFYISTRSFIRSHHRWIKLPKVIILCCYEKSVEPRGKGPDMWPPRTDTTEQG
jgi:hypothetical protein